MGVIVLSANEEHKGARRPHPPARAGDFFFKKNRSLTCLFQFFVVPLHPKLFKADVLSAVSVVRIAWAMLPMVLMPARCTSMATMLPRLPMRTTARSSIDPNLQDKAWPLGRTYREMIARVVTSGEPHTYPDDLQTIVQQIHFFIH